MLPIDPALYALFFGMMAVFAVTPGPANLFAIATGARAGPGAALAGVAGMNVASLVWLLAAALGLGALVHAFPAAFRLIAIAGGLYVAWLGAKALWSALKGEGARFEGAKGATRRTAFRDGFAVQLSNPKAVVFFTAVLPPFIDPSRAAIRQLLLLGATVILLDLVAMSGYGVAGGALAHALQKPAMGRAFTGIVGVLLLIAAAMIGLREFGLRE